MNIRRIAITAATVNSISNEQARKAAIRAAIRDRSRGINLLVKDGMSYGEAVREYDRRAKLAKVQTAKAA